jgi:hypothetical protein
MNYSRISLLSSKETSIITEKSIRNIEALQVDKTFARALENPEEIKGMSFFNSLKSFAPVEQYEHLNQLLYNYRNKV